MIAITKTEIQWMQACIDHEIDALSSAIDEGYTFCAPRRDGLIALAQKLDKAKLGSDRRIEIKR